MTNAYGTNGDARDAVRAAAETFEDAAVDVRTETKRAAKRAQKSAIAASGALAEAATTFARDARILIDAGFGLERVTPVDQFLWSGHVELVGVFRR